MAATRHATSTVIREEYSVSKKYFTPLFGTDKLQSWYMNSTWLHALVLINIIIMKAVFRPMRWCAYASNYWYFLTLPNAIAKDVFGCLKFQLDPQVVSASNSGASISPNRSALILMFDIRRACAVWSWLLQYFEQSNKKLFLSVASHWIWRPYTNCRLHMSISKTAALAEKNTLETIKQNI